MPLPYDNPITPIVARALAVLDDLDTVEEPASVEEPAPMDDDFWASIDALLDDLEPVRPSEDPKASAVLAPAEVGKSINPDHRESVSPKQAEKPMAYVLPVTLPIAENVPVDALSVIKGEAPSLPSSPNTLPNTPSKPLFKHGKEYKTEDSFTPIERRSMPQWRDLDERGRALAIHRYLTRDPNREVYGFSLELSDKVRKTAEASDSAIGYVYARIVRELAKRLPGPARDFMIGAEVRTKTGNRFHVHGELVFDREEAPIVTEALEAAGGENWKPKRRGERQVDFSDFRRPDDAWLAGYALKDHRASKRLLSGSIIASTRNAANGGKDFFNEWRRSETV